ncbi:MAG: acetyltransferase [Cytophagales bacterium]|nr:acetyltransferase [Cytophagales bacterium]
MLLYGAGGHAKVVMDCILSHNQEVGGIFDDKSELLSLNGFDVLGPYDPNYLAEQEIVISIGDNQLRKNVVKDIKHQFGKAIHSSAIVSDYAHVGEGSVIMHNTVLQSGAKVGKHCIINTSSSIDHSCIIEDFAHISPKVTLCDNVKVGKGTHIGAGATVIPRITIGKWCVIGAGAVITQNLPDYSFVVGVPGKVIRKTTE